MLSQIAGLCFLVLFATLSNALIVIEPSSLDIWTATGPNQIAWQNELGDPSTISLQLLHNNLSSYAASPALPANGVFASLVPIATDIFVFSPACAPGFPDNGARLPSGTGFQVRFVSGNGTANGTVLATSDVFRIAPAASATACATGGLLSAGGSPTASPAEASSTAAASGSLSTSTHAHTAAIVGGTVAGVLALLAAAGAGVWLRRRRRATRRETMAYALRLQDRMGLGARDGKGAQAGAGAGA